MSDSRSWTPCSRRQCRSEEHTSELQSQSNLVCRLLLEKKKKTNTYTYSSNKLTSLNQLEPPLQSMPVIHSHSLITILPRLPVLQSTALSSLMYPPHHTY